MIFTPYDILPLKTICKESVMVDINTITDEEIFVYNISNGKTKSDAYRSILPTEGLTKNYVNQLAFRYSCRPMVRKMLSEIDDYSFMDYINRRKQVLKGLEDIALNGETNRARIDSSTAYLQHTSKQMKQLSIDVTHHDEARTLLDDLRSTLLVEVDTPLSLSLKDKNSKNKNYEKISDVSKNIESKNIQKSENFSNNDDTGSVYICKHCLKSRGDCCCITLDGELVDEGVFVEHVEGLNPPRPNDAVKGVTGRFRGKGGLFVKDEVVRRMVMEEE